MLRMPDREAESRNIVPARRGQAEPLRQNRCRGITGLDRRAHLRRGLLVKMGQHVRTPLRMSLRTDLAMKNADRRGDM